MVATYVEINAKVSKSFAARNQNINVGFPKSPRFLRVETVHKTDWRGCLRGLASGEVVVILVARPVVLTHPSLRVQPRSEVVLNRQIAKNAVAANVLKLLRKREIGVGAVHKPRINKLVASGIELLGFQQVQWH